MSLDVYLVKPEHVMCGECGQQTKREYVFEANITHNMNGMAEAAGIYEALWRPDEIGITHAKQLIAPLTEGLAKMKADPEGMKKFDPPNKWGSYEVFVPWVEKYLDACRDYPDAEVSVSR